MPELALAARANCTAKLCGHRLHAETDTEYRHVGFEHRSSHTRRLTAQHGLGAAGKNNAPRRERLDDCTVDVPRMNFRVDTAFTDAPRDELRVLRTEVEDQDPVGVNIVSARG